VAQILNLNDLTAIRIFTDRKSKFTPDCLYFLLPVVVNPFLLKGIRHGRLIMGKKDLLKLILACWLALIGWANPGWASDVADCCQQLYKNGQYEQAFPVCRKAAEQGNAQAQFILGRMYYFGKGVQQDYSKAVKWYRKAAEQGYAKAQCNLAVMYARGKGVLQSGTAAADWYYKAGLSYLKEGKKDDALRCIERIKSLKTVLHLSVPDAFLADRLFTTIYGGSVPNTLPAPKRNQK
jgi:TPR repeat protein